MERVAVESSQLKAVGYDAATKTMEIEFPTGSVYSYANVPASVHKGLMEAPSKGRFFGKQIKACPDKYPFTKLCGPTGKAAQ